MADNVFHKKKKKKWEGKGGDVELDFDFDECFINLLYINGHVTYALPLMIVIMLPLVVFSTQFVAVM